MLAALLLPAASLAVVLHNASDCCCQNIYPRSAKNLVSTVAECVTSCQGDPLCKAAIFITTDVETQCQLSTPASASKACCIHKPHFDGLSPNAHNTEDGRYIYEAGYCSGPKERHSRRRRRG